MRKLRQGSIRFLATALRRAWKDERGVASMEFVLVVPVLLAIFMASFESGLFMVREILLEQALDRTMRELRLGHIPNVTNLVLKQEICSRALIFSNCEANMKVDLQRVSTATFTMPDTPAQCLSRNAEAEPVVAVDFGQQNDLMLVRACVRADAIFPTTGLGLNLVQADGAYGIIARSAFVVEPR